MENEPLQEYKFDNKNHIHTYCDKPLLGTSTVIGVLAKPLTWWASGLACAKFGWINKGNATKGWTKKEDRLKKAEESLISIKGLEVEAYLELLDEAYKAHSVKLTDTADIGTFLHEECERFVKDRMNGKVGEYPEKIQPFIDWTNQNIKRFLWSELYCYSNILWVGGISDVGVELNDGQYGVLDFKSSKDSYDSQFIQCAGYDIEISENGGFTFDGYPIFKLDKPITFYGIIPFGAEKFRVDFRYNVEDLKEGFKSCVILHKLTNK